MAAKAAGYSMLRHGPSTNGRQARLDNGIFWQPFDNDGDALRLAVKLDLDIELQTDSVWANGIGVQNYQLFEWHNNDKFKATRRAIVRAAAEIGKTL